MKKFFLVSFLSIAIAETSFTQIVEVRNGTIYAVNDVNGPGEFSKAKGNFLFIRNIIPAGIPASSRKISIISSISTKIDTKMIQGVDNKHLIIPIELFKEKYYTLYIGKGNATILSKKLIIR